MRRITWLPGSPASGGGGGSSGGGVRGAVAGDDHRSIGRGEQGLPVADVAGQLVGVADPRTMALVELHPIDGEALRDDLVAVHDEQAPAMMWGSSQQPSAATQSPPPTGGPSSNGFWAPTATRPTKLENWIDSPPVGGRAEPTTRCSKSASRSAFRCTGTSSQTTADPDGASWVAVGDGGGRSGGTPAGVSPTRSSSRPGQARQARAAPGGSWHRGHRLARGRPRARRVRQHQLIRDVKAPIGAPHGAWAREHRRREDGELVVGLDPRHIGAGVSRGPRHRPGRDPRRRDQGRDDDREQPCPTLRHSRDRLFRRMPPIAHSSVRLGGVLDAVEERIRVTNLPPGGRGGPCRGLLVDRADQGVAVKTNGRLRPAKTSGLSARPKCRWGPTEGPVFPILASRAPAFTTSPTFTVRLPGCKCT